MIKSHTITEQLICINICRITEYLILSYLGPPSEPAGVMIEDGSINATAATVKWKASHDNGANILSFVIEALNMREGFWKIIRTSKYM